MTGGRFRDSQKISVSAVRMGNEQITELSADSCQLYSEEMTRERASSLDIERFEKYKLRIFKLVPFVAVEESDEE